MKRWAGLLMGAATVAAVLVFFSGTGAAPSGEPLGPPDAAVVLPPTAGSAENLPDSVRVQHEFVEVEIRAPRPRVNPVRQVANPVRQVAPARRVEAGKPREEPPRPPVGLAARASRILLGDGRHRPEPFPRPEAEK